jgi:anti-sigma regulatory factor (Ser/Thr protein kinase)
LRVPGVIGVRHVVLDAVSAAAHLVMARIDPQGERTRLFADMVVGAVGEVFNNIVLHGRHDGEADLVYLRMEVQRGRLRLTIDDFGISFIAPGVRAQPRAAPPGSAGARAVGGSAHR